MKKHFLLFLFCSIPLVCWAVCPTLLGKSAVGGTANPALTGKAWYEGVTQTTGYSSTSDSGQVYFSAFAGNVIMALYSDNAGAPGNVLAQSNSQAAASGLNILSWVTPVQLTSGTKYWWAFEVDSGTSATQYDLATNLRAFSTQTYGSFANNPAITQPNNIQSTGGLLECTYGPLPPGF